MIAKGLHTALKQDGYAVDGVSDGASAAAALRSSRFRCRAPRSRLARARRPRGAARAAFARRCDAGDHRHRTRRRSESHPGTRRGRGRLHHQAVRSRRGGGAHAFGAAPSGRTRRAAHPSSRHHARSGVACRRARRRAGRPVGARVRRPRSPDAAPRLGAVARAARGPAVWMVRRHREQRRSRCTCTDCGASSAPMRSARCVAWATSCRRNR